jgi:hypothetical protein
MTAAEPRTEAVRLCGATAAGSTLVPHPHSELATVSFPEFILRWTIRAGLVLNRYNVKGHNCQKPNEKDI